MHEIPRFSLPERVAEHLREGIRQGRWSDRLPGVPRLAAELDVAQRTVRRALQLLEAEGLLSGRGVGRSRGITAAGADGALARPLRVGILRYEARLTDNPQIAMVLSEIMQALEAAGHVVCLCKKSQVELKHDFRRMTRQLAETRADAWVIEAGSRELLEWSASQPVPCLALYGRTSGLALARTGPDKVPAYRAATRRLLELGHRRIVLVVRAARRLPSPGTCECGFLEELAAHGIPAGDYHLPDWEESPEGFSKLLERLFQHSPPTAIIVDEAARYIAAAEFLARRGIHVPKHVSLVSTDDDAALAWCHPSVAHMRWDNAPIVRRVVRWVAAVRRGNPRAHDGVPQADAREMAEHDAGTEAAVPAESPTHRGIPQESSEGRRLTGCGHSARLLLRKDHSPWSSLSAPTPEMRNHGVTTRTTGLPDCFGPGLRHVWPYHCQAAIYLS